MAAKGATMVVQTSILFENVLNSILFKNVQHLVPIFSTVYPLEAILTKPAQIAEFAGKTRI